MNPHVDPLTFSQLVEVVLIVASIAVASATAALLIALVVKHSYTGFAKWWVRHKFTERRKWKKEGADTVTIIENDGTRYIAPRYTNEDGLWWSPGPAFWCEDETLWLSLDGSIRGIPNFDRWELGVKLK